MSLPVAQGEGGEGTGGEPHAPAQPEGGRAGLGRSEPPTPSFPLGGDPTTLPKLSTFTQECPPILCCTFDTCTKTIQALSASPEGPMPATPLQTSWDSHSPPPPHPVRPTA